MHPEVLASMMPYFSQNFGNAASKTHAFGWVAADAVKAARNDMATLLECSEQEITFTSGSTESINLAIKGIWELYQAKGNEIVTVSTEHKAVLDTCKYLETKGARVTYLQVDQNGLIDLKQLETAVTDKTILVAVMLANNETGVIQDLRAISGIVHRKGSILFSDTTQGFGKISVNIHELGIDICCLSAHKIYGPKGVGALYARRKDPRVNLSALIHGGGHERGLRSGTLNVPGIVGLGRAVRLIPEAITQYLEVKKWKDRMETDLLKTGKVKINGAGVSRIPNTSNFSIQGMKADELITKLPLLAMATGSACTSALPEPSHVLKAMGVSDKDSYASLRISLGINNTEEEIKNATLTLLQLINLSSRA